MYRFFINILLLTMTLSVIAPLVQQWQKGNMKQELVETESNSDTDDLQETLEKESKYHFDMSILIDKVFSPIALASKSEILYSNPFMQGMYNSLPFLPPEA